MNKISDKIMTLNISTPYSIEQKVILFFNNKKIIDFVAGGPEFKNYNIMIPNNIINDDKLNELLLIYPNSKGLNEYGFNDNRKLALAFKSLSFSDISKNYINDNIAGIDKSINIVPLNNDLINKINKKPRVIKIPFLKNKNAKLVIVTNKNTNTDSENIIIELPDGRKINFVYFCSGLGFRELLVNNLSNNSSSLNLHISDNISIEKIYWELNNE
jgi:hypothetical protein